MIESIPWEAVANILTVILGVATIAYSVWRWGKRVLAWGGAKIVELATKRPIELVPRQTVILINNDHGSFWHLGSVNDRPATQISAHFHVTNVTNRLARLVRVDLVQPRRAHEYCSGHIMVRHPDSNVYSGSYPIRPHATVPASISFMVRPPLSELGKELTVAFDVVDQFGNKHRTETIRLKNH